MSTKTTFKRIALVAVASMGFGMLSAAPSSADEAAAADITSITAFVATHSSNRTGVVAEFDSAIVNTFAADAVDTETVTMKSALISKPTGSTATTAVACEDDNGDADSDNTNYASANCIYTLADASDASATLDVDLRITPDVAGVYEILFWHDRDGQGDLDSGEKYKTVKFTAVAGSDALSATLSAVNATSSAGEADGSLLKVAITTSAGTFASLGGLEQFTLAADGGTLTEVGGGNAATGASISLSRNDFNGKGTAYVRLTSAVATRTVTLTGSLGSAVTSIAKSASVSFKTVTAETVNEADGAVTATNTTGVEIETAFEDDADGRWEIKDDTATGVAFSATMDGLVADNEGTYLNVKVVDTRGAITGLVGAEYDIAALVGSTNKATWSVTATLDKDAAAGAQTFAVTFDDEDQAAGADYGAGDAAIVVGSEASDEASVTLSPTDSFRAVAGSALTITARVKDQFGLAMANAGVVVSHTNRNAHITSSTKSTDSSGYITYTFTDAPLATDTNTSATVTFTADSASDDAVVTYVASLGVSTVTLTGGNTTAGVTATTVTVKDIDAGLDGASATTHGVSAVIKDANGSVLSGVPVVWTISGTTAAVLSTKVTTYTDGTGTASTEVYGWVAGTYTVTATADTKTGTATITFGQSAAGEERAISVKAEGAIVTATVVDRFGNPVPSVSVYATKVGSGYFGAGTTKATTTTNSAGVAEFVIAGGSATVTVSTINYDSVAGSYGSGQTSAPKGYRLNSASATTLATYAFTAYTAGTTAIAEDGVGASFDAAGVASATVEVVADTTTSDAATAAADAAAEATDAANAATDAANAAAEAADAATAAAQDAADAVAALSTQVAEMVNALKKQITALTNLVIKIQKKVKA